MPLHRLLVEPTLSSDNQESQERLSDHPSWIRIEQTLETTSSFLRW